jgi:cupin 2 domain-containing protein
MEPSGNIFAEIPAARAHEQIAELFSAPNLRIERIVSCGHASPPAFWYDQDSGEWILLLQGAAQVRFEGEHPISLRVGDYLYIPPHARHRVEWTDPEQATVWLAIHHS